MKQLVHIHFIGVNRGYNMNPGEYKGVFRVNVIIGWSLKFWECLICMERYFRNPWGWCSAGHWEGRFLPRKRKLTL